MILADTSVWVEHLRRGSPRLSALLEEGRILCHPFIVGELACGNLRNRTEILSLLEALPCAAAAAHDETLQFVLLHELHGKGLGWIDVQLLASSRLTGCTLWTKDKRLAAAARRLDVQA